MNENIVFIVGVGRSGTSLLQSMFAAHPQVNSLPEFSFLRRFVVPRLLQSEFKKAGGKADGEKTDSEKADSEKADSEKADSETAEGEKTEGEKAVQKLLQDDKFLARLELDYSRIIPSDIQNVSNLDAEVYKNILSICFDEEYQWTVEKDPRLVEYLLLISTLFPQAKVLHIVRDPRDVLVSKKSAKWSRSGHVWKHVFANRVQLALGRANGPALFGSSYQEILYEELILAAEAVLQRLCENINLPYYSQMLSFGDAAKKLVSESEYSWKKETLGPLLKNNKQKWKLKLTPREIRLTELCCAEAMLTGNYEVDDRNHKLGVLDKLWLFFGRLVITLAAYPLYCLHRIVKWQRYAKKWCD